ncbi:MAG: transposase [Candidatus Aminicenantia bacterium]
MSKLSRFDVGNYPHFITTKTRNNIPIFSNPILARACLLFIEELHIDLKFKVMGYILMPDHLHLILVLPEGKNISYIMKRIKGATARKINILIGKIGTLWQSDFYDHIIKNEKELRDKLKYIHRNPLRSDLVKDLREYEFSSFRTYENDNVILKVDFDFLK